MQRAAEKALKEGLPVNRNHEGALSQPPGGAIVGLAPDGGEIRVMVGGRGEDRFNRTTQALRSPGSAIKIFLYTAAIDQASPPQMFIWMNPQISS